MPTLTPIAGQPITVTSATVANDVWTLTGTGYTALGAGGAPKGFAAVSATVATIPAQCIASYA